MQWRIGRAKKLGGRAFPAARRQSSAGGSGYYADKRAAPKTGNRLADFPLKIGRDGTENGL